MKATFKFYAVGQGTFYGGAIRKAQRNFVVVYDCGSVSKKAHLKKSIDEFRDAFQHIDLLIVSHFHKDHVNGIKSLIEDRRVERVVLPYVPLFHRLALVAADDDPDDEYIRLLTDPTGYFLGEESPFDVGELIYIDQGSSNVDAIITPDDGPLSGSILEADDSESLFSINGIQDDAEVRKKIENEEKSLVREGVSFLGPFSHLTLGVGVWEFIFYHRKTRDETNVSAFRAELEAFMEDNGFISFRELFHVDRTAYEVARIYEVTLGIKGKLNYSSLCVYHGSLIGGRFYRRTCSVHMGLEQRLAKCPRRYHLLTHLGSSVRGQGTILTGDQHLKSEEDFSSFIHFFASRLGRVQVFQVPHHGSPANWMDMPNELNDWDKYGNRDGCRCAYVINHGYGREHHPSQHVLENLLTFSIGPVVLNNEHVELICEWYSRPIR